MYVAQLSCSDIPTENAKLFICKLLFMERFTKLYSCLTFPSYGNQYFATNFSSVLDNLQILVHNGYAIHSSNEAQFSHFNGHLKLHHRFHSRLAV